MKYILMMNTMKANTPGFPGWSQSDIKGHMAFMVNLYKDLQKSGELEVLVKVHHERHVPLDITLRPARESGGVGLHGVHHQNVFHRLAPSIFAPVVRFS